MNSPTPRLTYTDRSVYRILDANLDRAREGLRVLEDWCRFGLNHHDLTEKLKHLRQSLVQWHTADLRAARDTPRDTGTAITHPQEKVRSGVTQVLQANFCRVEEALRSLEEFGKIYRPEMADACKQMRYQVYVLESTLLGHHRYQQMMQAQLYLVTSPTDNLPGIVEAALQGGVQIVQYREKEGDDCDRIGVARQLRDLCQRYGALFLVNDRVDLAMAVDADGVHLGQQDLPIAVARDLLGNGYIVGRSTTNPEEMAKAVAEGADYIGVGPVYATPTKPDKAAAGLEYVRYAAQNSPVPFFAIGGIDLQNIDEVMAAGCDRVAVVRALIKADNPTTASQAFLAHLRSSLGTSQRLNAAPSLFAEASQKTGFPQ
ncbi:thiamine phosphate synthase [Oscillatoria sp. CS-180]|uniref:thiamine phosphate synthase n=1 Tax=Oscillatoria sp. CS-180 TaxID=3021720 RepID=UPI00232ADB17|nr:thiamine phosphate synthase [Oscillatoria sp. CS-180]MDB9525352.1 thiamine phosphate synthase [Oscillatoria sp. CS-180]